MSESHQAKTGERKSVSARLDFPAVKDPGRDKNFKKAAVQLSVIH
jgi:hypothetical protein